ncbi:acrylyl-CoA reductase (NADPH) [Streptomyces beijiangensis]|uniref:Oxidoreductase n=1 Tax=Streptomyces beijiangensis TaxID=163361 RepID=A0A939JH36_9ACTN|nr:MDR family oxidoreductase [Streptomyces beijiangensis]MBO0514053.1 oxidoreductase [Streptomyces beijiangensis]
MSFRAIRVVSDEAGRRAETVTLDESDLHEGDVTVAVDYSTVNYKDGLALADKGIVRTYPLVPGIDFAGTVESSAHARFAPGDKVVLNGYGVGESHHGGFSQKARVSGDWLVPLPAGLTTRQAAAIGTAGYTAMLSVLALEDAGVTPESGDILVTGAAGGVGSVAVALLAKLGYRVLASTGRPETSDYLHALGAAEIIDRTTLSEPGRRPLASERWAGAVDSVGSHTLVNVLAATRYGGTVTTCGLAQGIELPGTVLPFILRGVTLAGIDSVQAPMERRIRAYDRLARDLDLAKLESMTTVVGLDEVPAVADRILAGQVRGRTVVDVNA